MDEIEDIKRRLLELENIHPGKTQKDPEKKEKKQNAYQAHMSKRPYQAHMSKRLLELKLEAQNQNIPFDHKQAFSQAAKEWSAKKPNN